MSKPEKNFIVCKASAGSGKTFKLVNEYLKLCLLSDSKFKFGKILAITFTNKAAAEMKERIIEHLRALASKPNEPFYNESWMKHYKEITGLSEIIIQKRASDIRESILHNYTSLSISTIDKFTHKLIRSFARDLRLSADFEIKIESEEVISKSTDELISLAGQDSEVTEILEKYIDFLISEGENWEIEKGMNHFGKQLIDEESGLQIEKLSEMTHEDFKKVFSFINAKIKSHEEILTELGLRFFKTIDENSIPTEYFHGGTRGLNRHFITINKKDFSKDTFRLTDTDKNNLEKKNILKTAAIKNIDPKTKDLIETCILELAEILIKKQPKYIFYKLLRKSIYNLSLIKQLSNKLDEINQVDNTILIGEFNKIISEVVKNDPAPFIYERIGERYHHILIDEFQDTSKLQFNNILPLIENSLANNNKCLIVGDPKQAIYRWRGGDIDQFIQLPELESEVSKSIQQTILHNYISEDLTANYRSGKNIVDFNNDFFKAVSSSMNSDYQKVYSTLHQESTRKGGYVELNLWEKEKGKNQDEIILQSTLDKINECLSDGFAYSDIAILTRNKKEGILIAGKLHDLKIPVVSNESLLLANSREVNLIMNFIRYLAHPNDPIATFKIIELHQSLRNKNDSFDYELYKNPNNKYKFDVEKYLLENAIEVSRPHLLNYTSYQLILECVRMFFKNETNIYVRFLTEYVYNNWKSKPVDVLELCKWWEENSHKLSIQSTENKNAIRIMTIHSSKGLQFPVVIFPFADWKSKNGRDWIWVDLKNDDIPLKTTIVKSNSSYLDNSNYGSLKTNEKNKSELDDLNLMYVALTRPEKRLYILAEDDGTMKRYSPFLKSVLEEVDEKIWNKGEKEKYSTVDFKEENKFPITYVNLESWEQRLKLSLSNTSDKKEQEKLFLTKKAGILLHYILEKFPEINNAIDYLEMTASRDKSISKIKNELLEELKTVYSNKFIAELLKNKNTLSECSIVNKDGITYRPDKVCLQENNIIICDFKTGAVKIEHKDQLNDYGKLFSEMGYESIKKYLFYTKESKLMEVHEDV